MKNARIFLIHGLGGSPNGGWRPWLMSTLAEQDVYVCALPMPKPDAPIKEEWIEEIRRAVGIPDQNVFLVGHSLGVPAILQYLQTLPDGARIGGAVLVSGPVRVPDRERYAAIMSFSSPQFNFDRIKKACAQFAVIHGENDPVVPFTDAEEYARELGCTLVPIPNGGHLNGSAGWRELPQALDILNHYLSL